MGRKGCGGKKNGISTGASDLDAFNNNNAAVQANVIVQKK